MDLKQCPHCGAALPMDAALCTSCMTELGERTTIPVPKKRRHWLIPMGSVVALLLVAMLILLLPQEDISNTPGISEAPPMSDNAPDQPPAPEAPPTDTQAEGETAEQEEPYVGRTFDNGTNQVVYIDGRDIFYVTGHFLCYDSPLTVPLEKSQYYSMTLYSQSASTVATESRITILNDGRYDKALRQKFWDKVESFQVITSDIEGTDILRVRSSWQDKSDDTTAYQAQIGIHAYGTGRICWEFAMKKGDIIRVYTTVEVHPIAELELRPTAQEVPDITSLQIYLSEKTADVPRDNIVRVYLPGVTYEGELILENAVFLLYGREDHSTVFKGTITVPSHPTQGSEIHNIVFEGSGGTGVIAQKDLVVNKCTFSGYDIAIDWQNLAWVRLQNCTFRNNKIAMRVNNQSHHGTNDPNNNNLFENNGIALQFVKLSSDTPLTFPGCRFIGNETDIENTAGVAVDTFGAVFE